MENKKEKVDRLNKSIKTCQKCGLHLTRTNALCGEGNLSARLMLIAQAPGDIEDREGRMFIGPSGKILDELLNEAGVKRDEIYMTNLIKCRLPKNRRPKQNEIESCGCFLEEEIKLIDSDVIIPLGYYSSRYILESFKVDMPESRAEFSDTFGRLFIMRNKSIFPLPHPSSLLYNRSFKSKTIQKYKKLSTL